MRYFYNYTESNWVQTYKYTDQTWLVDSLNWEKISNIALSDYSLVSFLYNSSFINQHFIIDYISKISFLDVILIGTNVWSLSVTSLYIAFIKDLYLSFNIQYMSILPFFFSSYQDIFGVILLFSPELIISFNDYFYVYYFNSSIFFNVSTCFDSYVNNLNYNFNENLTAFFMFFFFSWFFIYFFYMSRYE